MKLSFITIALLASYLNAAKPFTASETMEKSEVEENIVGPGHAHDVAIANLFNNIRQIYLENRKVVEEIEKIGCRRPDIFKTFFTQNKDILPPTAARDILLQAIKKRHSPLVTLMLDTKEFDLTIDHKIILLAVKSFFTDKSHSISDYGRPHPYRETYNSHSYKSLNYIIKQALLGGVDLSFKKNSLLARAIISDFTPLIETLTMDPKVNKVGLTQEVKSAIIVRASEMSFCTAESIVRAFGVGPKEINEFFWNRHLFKSTSDHCSMIFEALGLPREEEVPFLNPSLFARPYVENEESDDDLSWNLSDGEEDINSDFEVEGDSDEIA